MKTLIKIPTPSFLIALVLGLVLQAQAVSPPPDGGYPNQNTAEGQNALFSLTTGHHNSAVGYLSLFADTTGFQNTANGAGALRNNTDGNYNTATGAQALFSNTISRDNTAIGYRALFSNTIGQGNTATGSQALANNTRDGNTATGEYALHYNTTGSFNTAIGASALEVNTGSDNVALGFLAGYHLTSGSGNVCIGQGVFGNAGESNTTRIANVYDSVAVGRAVYVNSGDKIGTLSSSRRYKEEIKPMDKASEAILELKPVTFRYKHELDPEGIPQYGLVAEEVDKVNPDLVARDEQGKPYTVRYEAVNAMLLNEFLKEHRTVQEQGGTIIELKKQIAALTAGLQKVSAQLELSKPAPHTVLNKQ
jgi:hypothetical protein